MTEYITKENKKLGIFDTLLGMASGFSASAIATIQLLSSKQAFVNLAENFNIFKYTSLSLLVLAALAFVRAQYVFTRDFRARQVKKH